MGWQSDDHPGHEGWEAPAFPGDWYGVGGDSRTALVRRYAPEPGPLREVGEPETGVDVRTLTGWRGLCSCGWRGPIWTRVATAEEESTVDRRIWWRDADVVACGAVPADVGDGILLEWQEHLELLEPPALADVRAAARAAGAATARLNAAVAAARADRRSWADIGTAAGISRQSAHERWARITVPARSCGEPYPAGPGRRCIRPDGHDGDHQAATGIDWPAGAARTRAVPWDEVVDGKGRPAWTAGQLRAALADLDDDAPVVVHVATDEDEVTDDQIITSAGHGRIDWGDGHGLDPDPLFALEAHWPAAGPLQARPARERRTS